MRRSSSDLIPAYPVSILCFTAVVVNAVTYLLAHVLVPESCADDLGFAERVYCSPFTGRGRLFVGR